MPTLIQNSSTLHEFQPDAKKATQHVSVLEPVNDGRTTRDYQNIRQAIAFLSNNRHQQPDLAALARHLNLSQTHCQKLFKRWCGLTPKEFVAALTLDHARQMLDAGAGVFDAALETGLSGGGRLHDLFVNTHAMTPGDHKAKGAGLKMSYGAHPTPFGVALALATERGLAGLAFVDEDKGQNAEDVLEEMKLRWPAANYVRAPDVTAPYVAHIFAIDDWSQQRPVQLVLIGTDFEIRIWRALLKVPMGSAVSYGALAQQVGDPGAARAVGQAVGRNPLSFVVPCHRARRANGNLGGYHWGVTRKQAIIGWEAGQIPKE